MNRKLERHAISISVLTLSLILLIYTEYSEFRYIALLGLASSLFLFLGSQDTSSNYYKVGKYLMWLQMLGFFTIISLKIGFIGIVLGIVCAAITYYVLRIIDNAPK
ncbi:hypothetical protein [Agaribacter marinus]|uniref:Uncharacterized protein n=1 Tax=Agaribacter marinus TaxID=1431249 RepID=A0AA37WIC4_9ALTE|nr:hypothetical protein [Agaribacter marinus]GLR69349.1 hypothetical protein GCM10007852_02570 [Agaribacter marinus]